MERNFLTCDLISTHFLFVYLSLVFISTTDCSNFWKNKSQLLVKWAIMLQILDTCPFKTIIKFFWVNNLEDK